jgi:hypothetical protein
MKRGQVLFVLALAGAAHVATASPALGNAGVFTGNGQNLRQITSQTIQLITVDVVIMLGRGRFLFDGSVSGMDQADYACTFVLRNRSDKTAEIQVGFPVDSQFANGPAREPGDAGGWVLDYSFIARDDKKTYHVEFVRREPRRPDDFAAIFLWRMSFAPRETKTLRVQYRIPMSMGLATTRRDGSARPDRELSLRTQLLLEASLLEFAGYVTSTGSSWAGSVETGTFTLITEPFELYLSRRGFFEVPASGLSATETTSLRETYPVQHPWWFRQIAPDGWQAIEGGVQWRYKDFKPRDLITVRYYVTQIPRLAEEVDAFVDNLLKPLAQEGGAPASQLRLAREVLLATYGKEPESDAAKAFVTGQIWYAPRKDFSMEGLSPTQKAVVKAFDRRIDAGK